MSKNQEKRPSLGLKIFMVGLMLLGAIVPSHARILTIAEKQILGEIRRTKSADVLGLKDAEAVALDIVRNKGLMALTNSRVALKMVSATPDSAPVPILDIHGTKTNVAINMNGNMSVRGSGGKAIQNQGFHQGIFTGNLTSASPSGVLALIHDITQANPQDICKVRVPIKDGKAQGVQVVLRRVDDQGQIDQRITANCYQDGSLVVTTHKTGAKHYFNDSGLYLGSMVDADNKNLTSNEQFSRRNRVRLAIREGEIADQMHHVNVLSARAQKFRMKLPKNSQ